MGNVSYEFVRERSLTRREATSSPRVVRVNTDFAPRNCTLPCQSFARLEPQNDARRGANAPRFVPKHMRMRSCRVDHTASRRNLVKYCVNGEGTMKKTGLFLAVVLLPPLVTALSAPSALARCGAFNLLEGDHYCVKCPSARPTKVYMCPGGPPGLAMAALNHINCSVSLYDHGCGEHAKHTQPH